MANIIDLRNGKPRTIICIRSENVTPKYGSDNEPFLIPGCPYELEEIDVHGNYTLLKVKGFDNWFNSDLFTEAPSEMDC